MTTKAKNGAGSALATTATNLPATTAEKEMVAYLHDFNELLETPFVQARAIAQTGTPFTIVRAGEREAENIDTGELEKQLFLFVALEAPLTYKNNAREERSFAAGENVIVSLKLNAIRSTILSKIEELVEAHGSIPHMTCRELPPSTKAKGKGWSPAVTICHVSQWEAL